MTGDPFARAKAQRALKEQVEAGRAVAANVHTHARLIRWAIENGLYVFVGRRPNDPDGPEAFTSSADYAWGSPFKFGPLYDRVKRAESVARYAAYLAGRADLLARIGELKGRVLGCHCKPDACHADVLAALANGASPSPD